MDKSPTEWMIEPLRKYAQFTGRARRAEYWWFFLAAFLVSVTATVFDSIVGLKPLGLSTAISLGLIVPQLAVAVRRLHDIDRTGWWFAAPIAVFVPFGAVLAMNVSNGGGMLAVLLGLAAFAFSVLMIVWYCTRGTAGPNRFGLDPLVHLAE